MATSRNFQLGLLPERKIDWRTLATSYGLEILLLLFLINIGLIWPERLQIVRKYHVTELVPMPSLQPKPFQPKVPEVVHAKLLPPAPVFPTAKLTVPRDVRTRPQAEVAPPKIVVNSFAPAALKQVSGGARPALVVHTGEFGSSATPTVNAPIQKVQTGGFGDPNGVPGQGKPNAKLVIASTGSFDLPQGSGQGNGTGGTRGIKGTIASAGFGNGIAQPGQGDGRSNGRGYGGGVQTAGFGAQQVAQPAARPQPQVDSGPPTTPVEITYKPNPVYTPEARQLKLEGEVLLEVRFTATGQLHVNRVVRGLGHGLDEAAIAAANKMRFKPALRNGVPVDSTAIVHVVFQLAY
ncbi:MAG TPA: energy transducer TonB [Terriglobales bacterium]|jgi:TonB family protein|nr:energy transducer TonB [Terriglobales bacterium]